ncbi:MAG: ribonuclease III [Erysipelotrichaceae bacterium]|nr:ribonuclease III [Erysipelotrichaceae bacterium]MBR2545565.1 ribonuclease III [Erysipelotrichaceae bacterium]MBR2701707.1 ribonuclease III [Erysipelotrichaceae bacterium]MBR2745463.1 ribonuclease III [Erysipelotrichaceae bacterium]
MNIYDWLAKHDIKISSHQLIDDAFTHTSYVNEHRQALHDNERLEFMGDAVMQIWVSEKLFLHKPVLSEGQMSKYRARIVCEKSFARLMRQMKLYQFIRLGAGEEKSGGRDRDSILADTFEAFIGALYLVAGMNEVNKILEKYVKPLTDNPENLEMTDYKTRLQEYVQSDIRKAVTYRLLKESGPSNNPVFEIGAYLDEVLLGKGSGHSKKEAEQMAAKEALRILVK